MKRIYVLSCDTLELENKTLGEMTVEEFKLFGKPYSINELVDGLNGYEPTFSIYHSWFRVIEEDDQPKLGQEQAFAYEFNHGMSKRLLLAGMAMKGILSSRETQLAIYSDSYNSSNPDKLNPTDYLSKVCYQNADSILKMENYVTDKRTETKVL